VTDDGRDLVDVVLALRERMAEAGMSRTLDALRLLSGYDGDHADHYRRRLRLTEARSFTVEDGFPCLRRDAVHPEVRRVTYQLDVDALSQPWLSLDDTMHIGHQSYDKPKHIAATAPFAAFFGSAVPRPGRRSRLRRGGCGKQILLRVGLERGQRRKQCRDAAVERGAIFGVERAQHRLGPRMDLGQRRFEQPPPGLGAGVLAQTPVVFGQCGG
jgi:hypothetical protein